MGKPAARMGDTTAHGSPLAPGPGSATVSIGGKPAWRGMSAAAVAALAQAVAELGEKIAKAQAKATAAAGTPAGPALQANVVKTAVEGVAQIAALMTSSGADVYACPMLTVLIPHGTGVVTNGSQTVFANGLPLCRVGDTIQEATAAGTIPMGCPTVMIGG
jgi:uncharacterized Zn-binding protein involved in type VI secretion